MSVSDMHGDGARAPGRGSRRFLHSRRTWRVLAAAAGAVLAVGIAIPALAVLSGSPSKFEANDGNMVVDTAGNSDWNSVQGSPNYVHLTDVANSTADDSFKSGQKQDTPCPVINTNKNPPKDDFTDVASFSETNGDSSSPQFRHTFLDGATIRFTANGSASENVELNQGTNGTCPGTTLLERSKGDKLIAIDYTTGGTTVTFHVLTWIVDSSDPANATCFVKTDSPPCWGVNSQPLSANAAEGLTNQAAIMAANNKINNKDLVTGQFAEFGVDLTAAGIVPANTCTAFPQTVWESRSSGSSFVSSTEDVSIEHHTISNCGNITIIKHTDPRGLDQVFSYTSNLPANASAGGVSGIDAQGNFSLNDKGNTSGDNTANTVSEQAFAGTYTVTEGADPTGFKFESLTCTGGTTSITGETVKITLAPDDNVTCTYLNKQQLGAIKVTKVSSKAAATPLAGAKFSVTGPGSFSATLTTGTDGTACVDNLAFGSYTVTETAAPPGYAIDNPNPVTVAVDHNASCTSGAPNAPDTFTDTPLTDVVAKATSEAPGGTKSTVTCVDSSNANIGNSPQVSKDPAEVDANGLKPGTYTCTIVIDP